MEMAQREPSIDMAVGGPVLKTRCIHTVATVRAARARTFLTPPPLAAVAYFTGEYMHGVQ